MWQATMVSPPLASENHIEVSGAANRFRTPWRGFGFTLVELLIVVIVIAVLAAIAIPRFASAGARSREAALRADLKLVRNAVDLFHSDTGAYPANMDALADSTPPGKGLDSSGATVLINSPDWKGPYLASVPLDPVSGDHLLYASATGSNITVGEVASSAPGLDSNGTPFRYY